MRFIYLLLLALVLAGCAASQPQAVHDDVMPGGVPTLVPERKGTAYPPDQLLLLALDQRAAGEYAPMRATIGQLLQQQPSAETAREAHFRWAEAAYLAGYADAEALLIAFVESSPTQDEWYARAMFLLARQQEDHGDHAAALATYERYRSLGTVLTPYAAIRMAAQRAALGDRAGQIADLTAAAGEVIAPVERAAVLEELIGFHREDGDATLVLARYVDLIAIAKKPAYRADVLWRAAQVAPDEQKIAWLRTIVDELPEEQQALAALDALAGAGVAVPALKAARIQFFHDQWDAALPLLDVALGDEITPAERAEAQHMRALALRGQGNVDAALEALGALSQSNQGAVSRQAELDYVQTVGQSGNTDWAIDGYRRFAANFPEDPLAPEALWRVVQLQQLSSNATAMDSALELGRAYPRSEQAHLALAEAGLYFYQQGAPQKAYDAWRMLGDGAEGWDRAEGYFWAGATALEYGQREAGEPLLEAAAIAAPHVYYGVRAREVLKRTDTSSGALGSGPTAQERQGVEAWLQSWTGGQVPPVDTGWLPDVIASPHVQRARALEAVSLRDEAHEEWQAAKDQWNDDPVRLWQLGLLANNAGQPYTALKAGERVVALSPAKRITAETPTGLLRLIYPAPYSRVVRQYARAQGIDPRLLYALLRQESLFNPDATSWVGARGLAQVMPSTAEGIAQQLDIPTYEPAQLYQPGTSVRFGAYYLGQQITSFDGLVQAAAAAYNGGPGNAQRWLEQTRDPDLFTELIDFRETRDYVKLVYGNWGMYRSLYGE